MGLIGPSQRPLVERLLNPQSDRRRSMEWVSGIATIDSTCGTEGFRGGGQFAEHQKHKEV